MKNKEEVTTNGRAVFYTILWEKFRIAALECGYALSLHGSMASDMDLIAVAWVEDAKPMEELVKAISDCIDTTIWKDYHFKLTEKSHKPHGRIVYTLSNYSDWYIDLSIIPPKKVIAVPMQDSHVYTFESAWKFFCERRGWGKVFFSSNDFNEDFGDFLMTNYTLKPIPNSPQDSKDLWDEVKAKFVEYRSMTRCDNSFHRFVDFAKENYTLTPINKIV